MESPGCINELLDFSSDVAEEEGNGKEEKPHLTGLGPVPLGLFDFDTYDPNYPLLDLAEEELEWISNKDAFPQIEAFGEMLPNFSLSEYPSAAEKQCSPVTVIETTSGGSNCSGSSAIGAMSCCLGAGGVAFPSKARSKRSRTERRDLRRLCAENPENSRRRKAVKAVNGTIVGRKCQHCGSEKTPQWRAGPAGPKTLCNACGVRYKSGRLIPEYRPASSPTYSAEMHSNSHRKILEMRRHRQFGGSTSTAGEPERCE